MENNEYQNEIEKLKNDKDEIYKALDERTKQKQNKDKYNKTFPNMNILNFKNKEPQNEMEKTKKIYVLYVYVIMIMISIKLRH